MNEALEGQPTGSGPTLTRIRLMDEGPMRVVQRLLPAQLPVLAKPSLLVAIEQRLDRLRERRAVVAV